jgi:hypothetical protein
MRPCSFRHLLAAMLLLACSSAAFSQRQLLDLSGGAGPPAPGTGAAALLLAEDLKLQAENLERGTDLHDRAKASLRRLARALIATGEHAGAPGSTRILLGRTLVEGLPGLDTLIASIDGPGSKARLLMIERDASGAAHLLESPAADPYRALRDGLALLTDLSPDPQGPAGWISDAPGTSEPAPSFAPKIDQWQSLPGASHDLGATLHDLDASLEPAQRWPAYRPSTDRQRALVAAAGDGLAGLPAWVPAASRQKLGEDFSRAVGTLLNHEAQSVGAAALNRIARLAHLAALTDRLDPSSAGKRVATALAQVMGAPPADPVAERRSLDAFERAAEMIADRHTPEDERKLVQQLRPAWRALAAGAKQIEPQLYTALPMLLRQSDAMTEPGVVATLNSARRALDDLNGLQALNTLIAGPEQPGHEPQVQQTWTKLAARVIKLGQDLVKPGPHDASLAALREIIAHSYTYRSLGGALPGQESAWKLLTGDRTDALSAKIENTRAACTEALEKGQSPGLERERLDSFSILISTLRDLAALEPGGLPGTLSPSYARIQSWPGWQMSGAALAALTPRLANATSEAVQLAIESDPAKTTEATLRIRRDYACAILAGRLARLAAARSIDSRALPGAVLREIGTGGPWDGCWLQDSASDLALICRYGEEIPVADRTGAKDRAKQLRRLVNETAAKVLDGLPLPS